MQAGSSVVHVDGLKVVIHLTKDNTLLYHVANKIVRWIFDNVQTFVRQKIKRKYYYDVILKIYHKSGNVFLGLIYRLNRPVSGGVIFGKVSKGTSRLSEQFRTHQVKKFIMY